MDRFNAAKRLPLWLGSALLSSAICTHTFASTTIDLSNAGNQGSGGYGNSLGFSGLDGGFSIDLTVTSYGETGAETPAHSGYYLFETAEVYSWSTGIGSCNQQEGLVGAGCSATEHEVDTINRDDLIVFFFNQNVNFEFLTVDPFRTGGDANDRDIIYWVGQVNALPDFTLQTFDTLGSLAGFSSETHEPASEGYLPFTHTLSGTGNVLLLSGNYHDISCKAHGSFREECEGYKIADITVSAVPVPAAAWLFGSALAGLLGYRRRPA